MEDVSLRLKSNLAIVERGQKYRALCSGLIALLRPLAIVVAVAVGATLAVVGTPEPAASVAKPAGELRLAMAGIGVMRPIPWQETPFSKGYFTLLYDFLIGANADGSMSAANGAVEKGEMSPDGMTWTFWLCKGITFHDGTELSAEDVKWSLEMVTKPESIAAFAARLRTTIKEIEVADPHTLIIRTHKPDLWLAQDLSMVAGYEGAILPKKYFEQVGADGFARAPIGSGPYRVAKNTIGSAIQLEALDQHWRDGVPRFKTVTFMLVPEESTRMAQLRTGEADVIAVSREKVPEVNAAGFQVFSKLNDQVIAVYMQRQWDPVPIADKRVRQALNLAIDKDAIMKFVFAGQGVPAPM